MSSLAWRLVAVPLACLMIVFSGCLASDEGNSLDSDQADKEEQDETSDQNNTTDSSEPVYRFSGNVVGAECPNPGSDGALAPGVPAAKIDKFTLKDNQTVMVESNIQQNVITGAGLARVEVKDPKGKLIYQSATAALIGAPGAGGVGAMLGTESKDKGTEAGEYEVHYYVCGAYAISVTASLVEPKETKDDEK